MTLLAEKDDYNMVSSWTDQLFCSRETDGTFCLWGEKDARGGDEDEYQQDIEVIHGIRSPKQFLDAFNEI